jgi:hypothetical protein
MEAFVAYCWEFYGPGKLYGDFFSGTLTLAELRVACAAVASGEGWGDGDSVDREHVRDLLLAARGKR